MVGRQSKWETHTTEYLSPETSHLKAKNVELAKALAESKTLYAQALRERDYFQKQFFSASLRVTKLEAYIDKIDAAAQSTINTLVKLSDYATEIVRYTNISKVPINIDKSLHSLSPISSKESISSEHKTQAVKPMISGHVILRPTVNLRRVNEISIEEIQRLQSDNNSAQRTEDILRGNAVQQNSSFNDSFRNLSTHGRETCRRLSERLSMEDSDDEIDDELIDQPLNSSDVEFERNSHFFSLDTIAEDQESHLNINIPMNNRQSSSASNRSSVAAISLPTTSAQLPLLSGVFKEVRVYLSPMDSHSNITRARGTGGRSLVKTSSESQSSHSNKNVSLMSLNNNLNATEKNQSENRLDLMNAFRGASCTSTPVQTFTVNGNETPNFQNFYDCNNGNINNSDLANENKKWLEEQRQHTECCSYPKKHIFSRPSNNTLSNIDCDPLEGPSNLLDTINSHKLEVLSNKEPKSHLTPAETVLTRRKQRETITETPKKHLKTFITERKSKKRKLSIVSNTSTLLIGPKKSKSPVKISPRKTLSLAENNNRKRRSKKTSTLDDSPKMSIKLSPRTPRRTIKSSPMSSDSSPSTLNFKRSPRKARVKKVVSMKEPSLRKKLRRSK